MEGVARIDKHLYMAEIWKARVKQMSREVKATEIN